MDKYRISIFVCTGESRVDWKAEQAATSDWGPPARPLSLSRLDTILSQVYSIQRCSPDKGKADSMFLSYTLYSH